MKIEMLIKDLVLQIEGHYASIFNLPFSCEPFVLFTICSPSLPQLWVFWYPFKRELSLHY
uniref:Uncharacterized protein n=1 Tax=Rhizophora mucronata TaxID=61149 RepID=A0A2P2QLM6_RHIMU